jgi:hypothetical protein
VTRRAPSDRDDDRDGPAASRRRALALAGGALVAPVGLAGCLAGGGPRPASDPWVRRRAVREPGTRGVEGVVRLRRGEFLAHPLAITAAETAGTLRVRARERLSLPVDVLTLRREALDAYRAGAPVDPISAVSAPDSPTARVEGRLPAGRYALVLDNTRLGDAPPLDAVRIGVRVALEV